MITNEQILKVIDDNDFKTFIDVFEKFYDDTKNKNIERREGLKIATWLMTELIFYNGSIENVITIDNFMPIQYCGKEFIDNYILTQDLIISAYTQFTKVLVKETNEIRKQNEMFEKHPVESIIKTFDYDLTILFIMLFAVVCLGFRFLIPFMFMIVTLIQLYWCGIIIEALESKKQKAVVFVLNIIYTVIIGLMWSAIK